MDRTTDDQDRTSFHKPPVDQPSHGIEAMIIPIPNATGEPIIIPIPNADPRDVSTLPLLHTHIYSDITSSFARRMDDIVAKGIFSGFDRAAENGEHIGVTFWKSTYEGNGNKPGEVTISKDDYTVK